MSNEDIKAYIINLIKGIDDYDILVKIYTFVKTIIH
jgi:hypothetical protein